jgi:hypothetical protein
MNDALADPALAYAVPAGHLLEKAGLGTLTAIHPISGGGNNRVFRLTTHTGHSVLLKAYFESPGDPRNRFLHEQSFHRLAAACDLNCVPQALAWDEEHRLGLFEFIEGRKLAPDEVDATHVSACAKFFQTLNAPGSAATLASSLPPASEACFSLEEHLHTVERRVQRLLDARSSGMLGEASELIAEELLPRWESVRASLLHQRQRESTLPQAKRCASPSDFGFHNALWSPRGLVFFDFEYSGSDDPAKMACDFFCQPEIPVPDNLLPLFLQGTLLSSWSPQDYSERVQALLPAYRIKWACIILNVFVPLDANRRRFADASLLSEEALNRQLQKARKQLAATF